MEKISCIIVEDDEISMVMATALIEKTGMITVRASFSNAAEAILWIADHDVDLIFLDVEMPGMSGMDMLRSLPHKPDVIIISSKPNHAVEAFDLAVADYLMKPLNDYPRFLNAVNKVIHRRRPNTVRNETNESIFVKVDSLLLKLQLDSVLWVEAFGDYLKIQTLDKVYTVYATLKRIEEKLDSKKFVRVHRSYIVNISKITNIDPNNLEINKKIIPIRGSYKDDLLSKLNVL